MEPSARVKDRFPDSIELPPLVWSLVSSSDRVVDGSRVTSTCVVPSKSRQVIFMDAKELPPLVWSLVTSCQTLFENSRVTSTCVEPSSLVCL